MKPGDICYISEGIYPEYVNPQETPVPKIINYF